MFVAHPLWLYAFIVYRFLSSIFRIKVSDKLLATIKILAKNKKIKVYINI